MSRQILDEDFVHPSIRPRLGSRYEETINEVKAAAVDSPVLVVGMAQNPFCKKVRRALDRAQIEYRYLEYGSYFKQWQRRLALKMWTGWPTFPMVFVGGQLVGGNHDVELLIDSGELKKLLAPVDERGA